MLTVEALQAAKSGTSGTFLCLSGTTELGARFSIVQLI